MRCVVQIMNNLVVLSMIIPLLIGVILIFFPKHICLLKFITFTIMIAILILLIGVILIFFPKHIGLQKFLTFASMIAILIISIILLVEIQNDGIITLDFGSWEAPFGISFVADSFATLLVITTSLISSIILLF